MNIARRSLADLAVCGGKPSYEKPIMVGVPSILDVEHFHEIIDDIFERKWLTNNGFYVRELERRLQEFMDVKNVILVNNGTTGLEIAIRALNLKGEVIVPAYTFIATPHSLLWSGVQPVFCDIDPESYNIDTDKASELINDRTSGILAVDVYGRPSEKDKLESLANDNSLSLIFDAAHAFGNSFHGKMIGNFGDAEVFSFHATKFMNSFEGGAIATNDDELASKCRAVRNFGFVDGYVTQYLGINGKMTEISAAMGIISLENIDKIISANKSNYETYAVRLKEIPGIRLIKYPDNDKSNYQYIIIEVDETVTRLNRDELSIVLESEGIGTRKYFWPGCHQMEPYRFMYPNVGTRLPETERISSRVLALPNGTSVSPEDVEAICGIIRIVLENPEKVKTQVNKFTAEV